MVYISAGEKKFHRLIQRHINAMDRELIADKFNLSVRTIQDIAQGRVNNIIVLTALVEQAKENIRMESLILNHYSENITKMNEAHFYMRRKAGVPDGMDEDFLGSTSNEVK